MFNLVLLEPRMPGNVGTIGRLAFAMDCTLHLIKPYGFGDITEKEVRRAGLDYWFELDVREYENIEEFWEKNPFSPRHFFATTKTKQNYFDASYEVGDYFYFGREDAGLPQEILDKRKESCITIPMTNDARSLNIANSVSIIAYEALRQNYKDFK
ncbi:tRNA (cytidine(34)-2'-O)-methyltransferase [Poseidonibacter ostreae]|mgnify:FL=1|jgi:tRNA (cytidine/uridine-2'-O-)-methyltransferase|uniref:Putative tRNA (cytidine(34)-2'-O)-methyltransferase n=1 Tax=Poseidonibacter ostreae TaxID=2654171 RepID=A0A6L4WX99_9BACT|nr:tRNA (cytidine(34)-2'-O)-methyltransferase [Poseidonibacter ostreae]KAB7887313.1 tRNA (cytidine(34)-2'-O)-methyltransferase [Poseidonibacter ostreae]KAB7890262.1 tRNA (cytidine(34)-2'-O)-methyltransferase [Poseidonibacter ostreae]KAB7890842.1 tRNA (cytidine(34)-2'-O)-methyltransferase [Poseidonibacter ostreae]MAC85234.1 RNA methyltransferase [Arcobacter sp.]|tara:strand:- start:3334 stop:3798 length:465 start_codon:yes stop_codon:yes gene_type:complete